MQKPLFSEEVLLAGWRDSHNSGATVTFWVGDSSKLDAFRGLTIKKGKTAGQRLAMVLIEINDNETLANDDDPPVAEPVKHKVGPLCLLAARWCQDKNFQRWMIDTYQIASYIGHAGLEEAVAIGLRDLCDIKSRRELDTDEKAANRFQTLIRLPYMKYCQTGQSPLTKA